MTGAAGARGVNVHLYPSPIRFESRIFRITETLAGDRRFDHVCVIGTLDPEVADSELLGPGRTIRRFARDLGGGGIVDRVRGTLRWSHAVWNALRAAPVSCVNCHSLPVLPLCVLLSWRHRARLVYDTHELETETASSSGLRRVLARLTERLLIRRSDAVVVVSDRIAAWYRNAYGIDRVTVVRNIPRRRATAPTRPGRLRSALQLDGDTRIALYQGLLDEGRGLDIVLDAFDRAVPGWALVFLGYGPKGDAIRARMAGRPWIHLHPAVPPDALPAFTVDADLGLCLIENTCLSYFHSLPNKLFEYLLCSVPVLASDFPEMRAVVTAHRCGWTVEPDAGTLRESLRRIDAPALDAARAGAMAARAAFDWEAEADVMRRLYDDLGFTARDEPEARVPGP